MGGSWGRHDLKSARSQGLSLRARLMTSVWNADTMRLTPIRVYQVIKLFSHKESQGRWGEADPEIGAL